MTFDNDGTPASDRRQAMSRTDSAEMPARPRSGVMRVFLGLAVLVLVMAAVYFYAARRSGNEMASNQPSTVSENKPAEPARQPSDASPSASQAPSALQPPSSRQQAGPTPPARQPEAAPAPIEPAQTPSPAASRSSQAEPSMRQQSTNLNDSEEMSVRVGRANIRDEPSRGARVVATVTKGMKVKVLGHSGDWIHIEAAGRSGWMSAKLLNPS